MWRIEWEMLSDIVILSSRRPVVRTDDWLFAELLLANHILHMFNDWLLFISHFTNHQSQSLCLSLPHMECYAFRRLASLVGREVFREFEMFLGRVLFVRGILLIENSGWVLMLGWWHKLSGNRRVVCFELGLSAFVTFLIGQRLFKSSSEHKLSLSVVHISLASLSSHPIFIRRLIYSLQLIISKLHYALLYL